MKTYAQDKEDVILRQILADVDKGFYIDVGANSPDTFSVTKLFYEQDWRGINIEPLPLHYEKLEAKRESDINLNIGISNKHGFLTLYMNDMLSTFDKQVAIDQKIEHNDQRKVEVFTMSEILNHYQPCEIHFCKIDVEGFEKQVLEGWDWNYRPWVFCMESTKPNTEIPCYSDWEFILLYAGYKLAYAHGINRYYVDFKNHPELLDKEIKI